MGHMDGQLLGYWEQVKVAIGNKTNKKSNKRALECSGPIGATPEEGQEAPRWAPSGAQAGALGLQKGYKTQWICNISGCQLLPRGKAGRPPALQQPLEVAQRSPDLGPGGRGAPFRSWAPPPLRGGRPKGPARPSGPNMCEPLSQGVLPHGGTPPAPGAPGVCVGGRQIGTGGAPAPILGACDGGPQIEGGPGPTTASAGAWSPMRGAGDLVNPSRAAPWGM